jgi:hypothetical protein
MDCLRRIYYVVHKLPKIIKTTIHFIIKHHVVDDKCKESMDKTKRLIVEEVDHTPNVKISTISLVVNGTLLVTHLLDDSGDDIMELLNGK